MSFWHKVIPIAAAGLLLAAWWLPGGTLLATAGTALTGAAGIIAWRTGRLGGGATAVTGNSIAVLPFKNISGDASQDYFSDGLSEELRSTLARNLKLQVMAQASAAKFRDRTEDAVTIASGLGVAYLLDGTVRKSGEVARITADLIDGRTGFSRRSQTGSRRVHPARQAFAKVEQEGDRLLYQQAQVLSQWDPHDRAIERLQKAMAIGDSGLVYARNDPRFGELLRSLGFE